MVKCAFFSFKRGGKIMGGSKWVTLWKVNPDGSRTKVGRITRQQQKKLLEAQERAANLANMAKMHKQPEPQAENTFRAKINSAKNKKELREAMLERYKPEHVDTTFTNKNLNMVKRILNTLDDLENQYPEVRGKVHKFVGTRKRALASMGVDGRLSINTTWSKEDDPSLYGDHNGWFHKNRTPEAVVAHEFAHAIQAKILEKLYPNDFVNGEISITSPLMNRMNISNEWNNGRYLSPIRDRALQKLGMTRAQAVEQISRYAGANNFELFAEAFADVFANGNNASAASKALTEEMIRELRK